MADDTIGLIDALGLERPHIAGASMGGMIVQNVAARFPQRIASLTSIMSTTGRRSLPQPSWKVRAALLRRPGRNFEESVARMMHVLRVIGSKTYPPEETYLRNLCERHVRRSNDPAGGARQLVAIAATGDRTAVVRQIGVPSLVIHGDEDPLIPLAAGVETARVIRDGGGDARLRMVEGMGHDLPLPLLSSIADEIAAHCRRSSAR
jgi:proline iminopeptidase